MNTELHKRLEEAARESFEERYPEGLDLYKNAQIDGFIAGAKHGYKEAIAQAKELVGGKLYGRNFDFMWQINDFISDFEADMNKLWEE